jgi:hypothetical protein
MKSFLALLIIFAVAHVLLIGLVVGEGYVLHWLIPSIDLSIAVLANLVATIATVAFVLQVLRIAYHVPFLADAGGDEAEAEEEDDDEADEEDEAPPRRPPG